MKFIFSYKLCISLSRQPSRYYTNSTSVMPSYRTSRNKVCILQRGTCLPGTVEEGEEPGSAGEQKGEGATCTPPDSWFFPGKGNMQLRVDSGSGRRSWRLRNPMQHCSAAPFTSVGGGDPSHSCVTHHCGLAEALGKRGRDH